MLTRDRLRQMNENELRKEILIPLFNAMGFKGVYDYHSGPLELGKDIVMWRQTETGSRENHAIVAKAHRITGRVKGGKGSVSEIGTQIEQCFGKPYEDPRNGSEQSVHKCLVVSSHKITKEAIQALAAKLKPAGLDRSIEFIDGDKLWELIEEHLIEKTFWENIDKLQKISDVISPHYRPNIRISNGKVKIGIAEKYPGASLDHPIELLASIKFPQTPEGVKLRADMEALRKKGTPVQIGKPFLQGLRLPDVIARITGQPIDPLMLQLKSSPPKKPLPVRVNVVPSKGESCSLEYVELVCQRVGVEEAFLTNEEQNIPMKFGLTLNNAEKRAKIDFRCRFDNLNVKQVFHYLCLQNALSKDGAIIITRTTDSFELFNFPVKEGQFSPPSEDWMMFLEDLVFIQIKTNCQIAFPTREITPEELDAVAKVRHILETGYVTGTWDPFTVSLYKKGVQDFLNKARNAPGQAIPLVLRREETEQIFGTEISLGPVEVSIKGAILDNKIEELECFLGTASERDSLQLKFKPHESDRAVMSYVNWRAKDGVGKIRSEKEDR